MRTSRVVGGSSLLYATNGGGWHKINEIDVFSFDRGGKHGGATNGVTIGRIHGDASAKRCVLDSAEA